MAQNVVIIDRNDYESLKTLLNDARVELDKLPTSFSKGEVDRKLVEMRMILYSEK